MRKLFSILLVLAGILLGAGSGYLLKPKPIDPGDDIVESETDINPSPKKRAVPDQTAFVKLNNQFVIPVVDETDVSALVVLSITLETLPADTELLYNIEPKIRDAALRVLFDHAYVGGFSGRFTAPTKLEPLRKGLLEAINLISNEVVLDVLITDIIRQDS